MRTRTAQAAWMVLACAALLSGCYQSHTRGDDAGAGRDVGRADAPIDSAPSCFLASPDEWIIPAATQRGGFTTEIPIGMRFRSGGCSCSTRPFDAEGRVGAEICDCCEECDCLPPSYELTLVHTERAAIDTFTPVAPNGFVGEAIEIVDWPCTPISEAAELVEIVVPDGIATPHRPVGVWAHVRGVHFRCSDRVLPLVIARGVVLPPIFVMEDCNPDPDPCGPITPTPYETNAFLGFYETGTYRTVAFGVEIEFAVP